MHHCIATFVNVTPTKTSYNWGLFHFCSVIIHFVVVYLIYWYNVGYRVHELCMRPSSRWVLLGGYCFSAFGLGSRMSHFPVPNGKYRQYQDYKRNAYACWNGSIITLLVTSTSILSYAFLYRNIVARRHQRGSYQLRGEDSGGLNPFSAVCP